MRDRLVQRILICFLFWGMFTDSYASETALDYSSRQVSFTAGQHSQWFSKQWDGKELKPGMKVRYRLEDPNHCITSYFLNNFNGKTTGDKFPNRDYVDVITEEMLDTPYGIGFYTREAVATGKGTFYYAIDNETPKTTNRILNFETVEIPKESIFDKEVRKLDKISKEVPDYGINAFDKIINVDNQASFDDLQVLINKAIGNGGKRILVRLDRDVFYYSEKHLFLTQYNYPNARGVKIKIEGVGGCKLIAGGRDYYKTKRTGESKNKFYCAASDIATVNTIYLDEGFHEISDIGNMKHALGLVEAVSFNGKDQKYVDEARIKIERGEWKENPTYIILTSQYQTCMFPVLWRQGQAVVKDGYLHFLATPVNLAHHNQFYTKNVELNYLNRDYTYGKQMPRYKLVNGESSGVCVKNGRIYIDKKYPFVHQCSAQTFIQIGLLSGSKSDDFMSVSPCPFESIELTGITFIGNADYGCNNYSPEYDQNALIRVDAFNNKGIYIHDNIFRNIRSRVCSVGGFFMDDNKARPAIKREEVVAQRIVFANNSAYDCYRGLISGSTYSKSIYCIGNVCKNMNRNMYYEGVFNLAGQDFLIRGNKVEDFPYSAVRSGIEDETFLKNPQLISKYASEGIIEDNEFGWSEDYLNNKSENALMDCGAVYTYCRQSRMIIRDNYIYNYNGLEASCGIYVDGYAENVKVYRNFVVNCGGESIRMYRNENEAFSSCYKRSNNNMCIYNFVTSPYYFTAYDNSVKGVNYVSSSMQGDNGENISVVPKEENDYYFYDAEVSGNMVIIPMRYNKAIKTIKMSEQTKKHLSCEE